MTNEREKLVSIYHAWQKLTHSSDKLPDKLAEMILAAGFRLVTPTSEGEAQKAARRIMALYATLPANAESAEDCAAIGRDALTVCEYILSLAPSKDVVEEAREIADNWCRRDQRWYELLAKQIAAFTTAHVARERADEREACKTIANMVADSDGWNGFARSAAKYIAGLISARTP